MDDVYLMLYRACNLLVAEFGNEMPDWVRIVANANRDHLPEAVEVALADDTYVDWEDEDGSDESES